MQPPQPSEQDLVTLYDDFTHLQSLCTFLCDAVVAIHIADIEINRRSVDGLHICARQVKQRAEALREKLQVMCEVID